MGTSSPKLDKSNEKVKRPMFLLFGQPIHIDQQIDMNANHTDHGLHSGTSHCKVFLESEDVGRTVDLSVLESYEQLKGTLANLFGIDNSSDVMYKDSAGDVKRIGDEPFSEFVRKARRLTIPSDACNANHGDIRKWNTSLQSGEHGVDSSNHQAGPMTIFA